MNKEVNEKNKKKFDISGIKDLVMDNKKIFIVSGVTLLVVIIVIVGAVAIFGNKSYGSKMEQYEATLREMGKDFYENYYYERTGKDDDERKEFDSDNKNVCDAKNTRVIIIPKEGYKKTDYEIKVELDCGFDTEEK